MRPSPRHPLALLLCLGGLLPASAHADWHGAFDSNALGIRINVQVRLPAAGVAGVLRFAEKSCSLALQPGDDAATYNVQRSDRQSDPGPYCAAWVGGTLGTTPAGNGALQTRILSRNGESHIDVRLRERP
jgi:hypothetical protein